jgi:hypothetical protein
MNFDRKYLVNDVLKAKCGAPIRVELVNSATGEVVDADFPGLKFEVSCLWGGHGEGGRAIEWSKHIMSAMRYRQVVVLDGHAYEAKFLEGGSRLPEGVVGGGAGGGESEEELESCCLLLNKKKVSSAANNRREM